MKFNFSLIKSFGLADLVNVHVYDRYKSNKMDISEKEKLA